MTNKTTLSDILPTSADIDNGGDNADNRDDSTSNILDQAGISRRQFIIATVATGGALTLGGQAAADHISEKTDKLYEFIQIHTEQDYEIQTLIRLNDAASQDELDALADT